MRKIYLFAITFILAVAVNAQSIVLVHNDDDATDPQVVQLKAAIEAAGISVTSTGISSWDVGAVTEDVVLFTEAPGSGGSATPIQEAVTVVPTVILKAYGIRADKGGLDWIPNDAEHWWADKASMDNNADIAGVSEVKILDDHDIFAGIGAKDATFSFATGFNEGQEAEAHFQCFVPAGGIDGQATALGQSTWAVAKSAALTNLLYVVPENAACKNSVIFAIHNHYVLSDAGVQLIINSLVWAGNLTDVKSISASEYNVFFANDILNINNAKTVKSVEIFDIAGKQVNVFENTSNDQQLKLNTNLNNGIYVVRVNSVNGQVYTQKFVK